MNIIRGWKNVVLKIGVKEGVDMEKYIGLQSIIKGCKFIGKEKLITTLVYDEDGNVVYPGQNNKLIKIIVDCCLEKTTNNKNEELLFITANITFKSRVFDITLRVVHSWMIREKNIEHHNDFIGNVGNYIAKCSCSMLMDAVNGFEYDMSIVEEHKDKLKERIYKSVQNLLKEEEN